MVFGNIWCLLTWDPEKGGKLFGGEGLRVKRENTQSLGLKNKAEVSVTLAQILPGSGLCIHTIH